MKIETSMIPSDRFDSHDVTLRIDLTAAPDMLPTVEEIGAALNAVLLARTITSKALDDQLIGAEVAPGQFTGITGVIQHTATMPVSPIIDAGLRGWLDYLRVADRPLYRSLSVGAVAAENNRRAAQWWHAQRAREVEIPRADCGCRQFDASQGEHGLACTYPVEFRPEP